MTIRAILFALPLILMGWAVTMTTVSLVSDAAPAKIVVLPTRALLDTLPDTAAVVGLSRWSVTLYAPDPGFGWWLFRHGAWLILPAGLQGCAPDASETGRLTALP